jgi:7-cyano-7-deazaguanine synthase in queuosine biosynthesis
MIRVRQPGGEWIRLGDGRSRQSLYRFSYCTSDVRDFQQPLTRDLLRIGPAFFLADRFFRRARPLGQRCRSLEIEVGVEEPGKWRRLAQQLARWAGFVTHDQWRIRFVRVPAPRQRAVAPAIQDRTAVVLYSGGLDSLCGAAMAFRAGVRPVFVTHSPPGRQAVARMTQAIRRAIRPGDQVDPWVSFRLQAIPWTRGGRKSLYPERSRRSRAVFFLSLAGAVAVETGIPLVLLNENGVMGINLPMEPFNTGVSISRHAHPETLRQFEQILCRIWPWPGTQPSVRNLLAELTKAEAVRELSAATPLAAETITCENAGQQIAMLRHHFARTRSGLMECGLCVPCLVRRSALARAGVMESRDHYAFALADATHPSPTVAAAPLWNTTRGNHAMIAGFCRRIVRMNPREFSHEFMYELALLPANWSEVKSTVSQCYGLYRRFAQQYLAYTRAHT